MNRIAAPIALTFLSAALVPAVASAVPLKIFEQAADDPPRLMALFRAILK
jgi:hypothetical protein